MSGLLASALYCDNCLASLHFLCWGVLLLFSVCLFLSSCFELIQFLLSGRSWEIKLCLVSRMFRRFLERGVCIISDEVSSIIIIVSIADRKSSFIPWPACLFGFGDLCIYIRIQYSDAWHQNISLRLFCCLFL